MNDIIDEIISTVLRDNLSILKSTPQNYKSVLSKYAGVLFEKLKDKNNKTTYGLQIGLTKKFVEFCLQNIVKLDLSLDSKELDDILKKTTTAAIQLLLEEIENDAIVYIMYRTLKKLVDNEFSQQTEICV